MLDVYLDSSWLCTAVSVLPVSRLATPHQAPFRPAPGDAASLPSAVTSGSAARRVFLKRPAPLRPSEDAGRFRCCFLPGMAVILPPGPSKWPSEGTDTGWPSPLTGGWREDRPALRRMAATPSPRPAARGRCRSAPWRLPPAVGCAGAGAAQAGVAARAPAGSRLRVRSPQVPRALPALAERGGWRPAVRAEERRYGRLKCNSCNDLPIGSSHPVVGSELILNLLMKLPEICPSYCGNQGKPFSPNVFILYLIQPPCSFWPAVPMPLALPATACAAQKFQCRRRARQESEPSPYCRASMRDLWTPAGLGQCWSQPPTLPKTAASFCLNIL